MSKQFELTNCIVNSYEINMAAFKMNLIKFNIHCIKLTYEMTKFTDIHQTFLINIRSLLTYT